MEVVAPMALVVGGLWGRMGLQTKGRLSFAPLKISLPAICDPGVVLGVEGGASVDPGVIEGTVILTRAKALELAADWDSIALGDLAAMGVEYVPVALIGLALPLRVGVTVVDNVAALSVAVTVVVLFLFILPVVNASWQVRLERPIVDYLLKHSGEVEGSGVEDSLLGGTEEVLDTYVHYVQYPSCKEVVVA